MHQDDDSGNQQKVKVEFVAAHMQVVVQVFFIANLLEVRDSHREIQVPLPSHDVYATGTP